jgi:hypothetical protein
MRRVGVPLRGLVSMPYKVCTSLSGRPSSGGAAHARPTEWRRHPNFVRCAERMRCQHRATNGAGLGAGFLGPACGASRKAGRGQQRAAGCDAVPTLTIFTPTGTPEILPVARHHQVGKTEGHRRRAVLSLCESRTRPQRGSACSKIAMTGEKRFLWTAARW